jgi:NAD(P)H-dependent flavin oxidoreductase YrpB (nitropropane dioxygenase family)
VAEGQSVDAVIATGFEAAGHVGHQPVHTFVLVPAIAEAVDIPVVCAGGVVDGRALAGALTLGAELGYMGTRFLAAAECDYHDNMKQYILARSETDPEVIPAFFGPARFHVESVAP